MKRGVHLLTNADMALLTLDAEEDAAEQPPGRLRRKRRDSAVLRGEKLTEEQITQACPYHEKVHIFHMLQQIRNAAAF